MDTLGRPIGQIAQRLMAQDRRQMVAVSNPVAPKFPSYPPDAGAYSAPGTNVLQSAFEPSCGRAGPSFLFPAEVDFRVASRAQRRRQDANSLPRPQQ